MTKRTVEPYLLVHSRGEWYYVCWCARPAARESFASPRPSVPACAARPLSHGRKSSSTCIAGRHPSFGQLRAKDATVWYGRSCGAGSPSVNPCRRWRTGVPGAAAVRGRALAHPPLAALLRPGASAGAAGGARRPPRHGEAPGRPVRAMIAADPLSNAYKAGWYFYALARNSSSACSSLPERQEVRG